MKHLFFVKLIVIVAILLPGIAFGASYSTKHRLIATSQNNPLLTTAALVGSTEMVYEFSLKNYAPKSDLWLAMNSLELRYRSTDLKRNELEKVIVWIDSPYYPQVIFVPVTMGQQNISVNFSPTGHQPLPPNEEIKVRVIATLSGDSTKAVPGESFQFSVSSINAEEMWTGLIVKPSLTASQGNWITIK